MCGERLFCHFSSVLAVSDSGYHSRASMAENIWDSKYVSCSAISRGVTWVTAKVKLAIAVAIVTGSLLARLGLRKVDQPFSPEGILLWHGIQALHYPLAVAMQDRFRGWDLFAREVWR
jgi:hypothetical protein